MNNIFISNIMIENIRHLKNIEIQLSKEKAKHLIFTGKNGSGKTSVLETIAGYLQGVADAGSLMKMGQNTGRKQHLSLEFNETEDVVQERFIKGQLVLAYYRAERIFKADVPKHIEKIQLRQNYMIDEEPRKIFVKYLLDLKVTEALARNSGNYQKADGIRLWFEKFQDLLRKIFDDETLELIFEEDSFAFFIKEEKISHFETYRYINNFFYCIPLIFVNSSSVNIKKTKIIYILTIIVLLFSFVKTIELRKFYSTLEQKERFEQVDIVSNFINKNNKPSILICENILLYQNICDSNFSVCSIILFDKINLNNEQIDYYCILSDLKYLKERYNVNIDTRLFKPLHLTIISKELIYGVGQCIGKVYNRPYSVYKTSRPKTYIIEHI